MVIMVVVIIAVVVMIGLNMVVCNLVPRAFI
jgi:hypothetical protein